MGLTKMMCMITVVKSNSRHDTSLAQNIAPYIKHNEVSNDKLFSSFAKWTKLSLRNVTLKSGTKLLN